MSEDERRTAGRYEVWFPMELSGETIHGPIAVSRDLSEKGILVASTDKPEVGADVKVTFRLPGKDKTQYTVEGVIVRVERNREDPKGLWRYQIAVQFDEPRPEFESTLERLCDEGEATRLET